MRARVSGHALNKATFHFTVYVERVFFSHFLVF